MIRKIHKPCKRIPGTKFFNISRTIRERHKIFRRNNLLSFNPIKRKYKNVIKNKLYGQLFKQITNREIS